MTKNFLFDLYGTLVDVRTDEWCDEFWRQIAELLGRRGDGQPIKARYEALCREASPADGAELDLLSVFSRLLTELGAKMSPTEFATRFRSASMRKLRLFEGAADLLDGLRARGAKVYLLSNAQACFTRRELESLGLADKFDGVILSSEIGWKKPSPKFFEAAFNRLSLSAGECIYVGNDLHDDVGGARAVGLRSVYIETEQSGKYFEAIPVDLAVSNHAELRSLLYGLAAGE